MTLLWPQPIAAQYRAYRVHSLVMHNHPSGDPTPSRADIEMTQAIVAVARPLGIAVHDPIVAGRAREPEGGATDLIPGTERGITAREYAP
jgi:proteasome lid subunit RPN8/RPN11